MKTDEPFKVSVPTAGEYYVNDEKYDLGRVIEYLSGEHAINPLRRLVLRADARLKYKDVREFLARTQEVGFRGTSFMVGERHRSGAQQPAQE